MRVISTIEELRSLHTERSIELGREQPLAFVPTMGNLHAGHLSLVQLAKQYAEQVMVSIFVNPLQFSPGEDLDSYPRTLKQDLALLETVGADYVFVPNEQELYPKGRSAQTQVYVPMLSTQLCGASRVNFFGGIATVVTKLLLLVRPQVAVFGQKDYQQWLVINQLVKDLYLDVELVLAPIVREPDGLAMSSRNGYLSQEERAVAYRVYRCLQSVRDHLQTGATINEAICQAKNELTDDFKLDYLVCRRADDLSEVSEENNLQMQGGASEFNSESKLIVLVAAMLGKTRLIDNLIL